MSPGAQINPSVTIRVTSGQLLVSRGDHLHAIPEDTTNTFGAWPVQAVKSNVSAGGTYTFDVNNDSGFRMTAPNTPGSYVSRWQLRVGGNHIGPVVQIPITVQTTTPPPTPVGLARTVLERLLQRQPLGQWPLQERRLYQTRFPSPRIGGVPARDPGVPAIASVFSTSDASAFRAAAIVFIAIATATAVFSFPNSGFPIPKREVASAAWTGVWTSRPVVGK